jgi:hypothetical protein
MTDAHRAALLQIIDRGPIPAIHGVVRWRLSDLGQWLWEEFRVSVSPQTLSRTLRAMGLRKLSARPKHHAQAAGAIEAFKKIFPATLAGIAQDQGCGRDALEIWFADEARIGQKNKITRRWARRGTRPSAPQDQRYASTYIFGAVCPREGKGAALVLPYCDTQAMNLHLAEIATDQPRPPCRTPARSSRMAHVRRRDRAGQHHPVAAAAEVPGTQRDGEHLAVHAR